MSHFLHNRSSERQTKALSTVEENSEKCEEGPDNIPFIDTNEIESEANQIETSLSYDEAIVNHVIRSCDSESQSDTGSVSTPDTVILTG